MWESLYRGSVGALDQMLLLRPRMHLVHVFLVIYLLPPLLCLQAAVHRKNNVEVVEAGRC